MSSRASSLDALRGYAILTMVLSATVLSSILPGWMSHAQTPPPGHVFRPDIPGITWVDLVFPFFLFSMGAAFPFSIRRHAGQGKTRLPLCYDAIKRGVKLTFFAIFIQHFYPSTTGSPQDLRSWLLAIACFAVLFLTFMRVPFVRSRASRTIVQTAGYGIAAIMLGTTSYAGGQPFSPYTSNVIILIMANMALFGSLAYIFTLHSPLSRICLLALLGGLFLSKDTEGSWVAACLSFSPLPWMFHPDYLQYLFIVIPGTFAGETLRKWLAHRKEGGAAPETSTGISLSILSLLLIVCNLYGLYTRNLVMNLIASLILTGSGCLLLRKRKPPKSLTPWRELFLSGSFFLLLGLFLEPFQGGIKKDYATFSYFFVTSGLAFMALLFFHVLCDRLKCTRSTRFLVMAGQNPMIAYVAGDLLVYPTLNILGITPLLNCFYASPWLGFLHGILLTSLVVLVTMFFTSVKWFWRT